MLSDLPEPSSISEEFLFHALTRAHFNAQQAGLRQQGLPDLGSPKILFALMEYPKNGVEAPSQKELADQLHISPATVAASLKSMEKCGYVSRRADAKDSRRNLIAITPKGRKSMETSRAVFDSVGRYMFHGFSEEERRQVFSFHYRMLQNLYQIGGNNDVGCPPPFPRKDG